MLNPEPGQEVTRNYTLGPPLPCADESPAVSQDCDIRTVSWLEKKKNRGTTLTTHYKQSDRAAPTAWMPPALGTLPAIQHLISLTHNQGEKGKSD